MSWVEWVETVHQKIIHLQKDDMICLFADDDGFEEKIRRTAKKRRKSTLCKYENHRLA